MTDKCRHNRLRGCCDQCKIAQLEAKAKEYHDQYHLCEAKLLSHKAIIRQLQDKVKQLNSGEQTK